MRLLVHILLVLGSFGSGVSSGTAWAVQVDDLLDLANVPLPVQQLPEDGYQVLTGGYLAPAEAISLIADPRNLDRESVADDVATIGLARAYVLDLVLPEDRAWQDSPVLAVQQTSVYVLENESNTGRLTDILTDYSSTAYVTEKDPAVHDAYTVATIGESGDMLRTVVSDGRVVVEIVSLDATGAPDETGHILIVQGTLERLDALRDTGDAGLSSAALTLMPSEDTARFGHTQQSGVHGIYRLRDGVFQPATGELNTAEIVPQDGLTSLYFTSDAARTGSGNAVVSIWLAEFDSETAASAYYDNLIATSPEGSFVDPYFVMDEDETWTGQGITGLYRVTGTFEGARYSGNVEMRLQGDTIFVVGYRAVGAALPGIDITSALVDHQLACIDSAQLCAPFDLASALPPAGTMAQATPIADASQPGSTEFGWQLPPLGPEWVVTEQFVDPGYDRTGLQNGRSLFEFESVINHHGDPMQCVLDELHMLQVFEEHADIRLWQDADGNTEGGNSADAAWVVYRVEPLADERADQEYVIRIDCFTLISGSANLVMTQIAPVDAWIDESPKGDNLREGLMLPSAFGPHDRLLVSAHDRRMSMIYMYWVDRTA